MAVQLVEREKVRLEFDRQHQHKQKRFAGLCIRG